MTLVLGAAVLLATPSWAAESATIDHVESDGSALKVLYSVPDLPDGVDADLDSVQVTVEGQQLEASAELASVAEADATVRRTTVLAIDVSNSMRGERFAQAKLAAEAFLAGVSPDVYVGIVAFAGDVETVQTPTQDREESAQVLEDLTLSLETRLYDGVLEAVEATGEDGQRSVLVLSDGRDTSETALDDVTAGIQSAGVKVNVVALAQAAKGLAPLEEIAGSGRGAVLPADDTDALLTLFADQAEALAQQVLVTAQLPADFASEEGTVAVSIEAGGDTYTATAFVPLQVGKPDAGSRRPAPAEATGFAVSQNMMLGGLLAAGVGVMLLLLSVMGVFSGRTPQTIEDRIAAYSRTGAASGHRAGRSPSVGNTGSQNLTTSAIGVAEKALASNQGVAASIGARLEAAGMSLKPAEWLLLHASIAVGAGFLVLFLTSGSAVMTALALLAGAVLPWMYLGFKRSRRVKAFSAQLPDTLQLISGGLSAGLSLAQSIDTVVRQGSEPMKSEFKRALMEARLGVSIEDAMESIGERMDSVDFKWVVIAVRVQREVGGNLSEVLKQVAATIREREYLRRQVKSLSAEGVLSAWILGALPPVMFAYFLMVRPEYMQPMFEEPLGWAMLAGGVVMMAIGAFWLSRLVKLEV